MEKLKLKDLNKEVKYYVNKNISAWIYVSQLLPSEKGRATYRKLDFDVYLPTKGVNLQRGFVWTQRQKSDFILAILREVDTGKLALIEVYEDSTTIGNKVIEVIDGKQRIGTVIDYIQNKFPVNFNGQDYYFDDLDDDAQSRLDHWSPIATIAYSYRDYKPITDEEKIEWFLKINFAGTPQDEEHHIKLEKLI